MKATDFLGITTPESTDLFYSGKIIGVEVLDRETRKPISRRLFRVLEGAYDRVYLNEIFADADGFLLGWMLFPCTEGVTPGITKEDVADALADNPHHIRVVEVELDLPLKLSEATE